MFSAYVWSLVHFTVTYSYLIERKERKRKEKEKERKSRKEKKISSQKVATLVYEDDQSAINISENLVEHLQMKHIATKYHFTCKKKKNGIVKLEYCPTKKWSLTF